MTLPLFVLMLFLLSSGLAKVVPDFEKECGVFFANRKSPTRFPGQQYKQICQNLNNLYYYATYYDTGNRIPVYSAYKFEGRMDCKRKTSWYIEPELDMKADIKPSNMASEGSVAKELRGKHQALNGDYVNSEYDRGHLVPVFHAGSQSCAYATFTLTNAAPQNSKFNSGKWRVLEGKIADVAKKCLKQTYSVYIVTGVVPGPTKIPKKIERVNVPRVNVPRVNVPRVNVPRVNVPRVNVPRVSVPRVNVPRVNVPRVSVPRVSVPRVNVPSHFWTAYCCLDQNNKCQISRGFIGANKNLTPRSMTVNDLEAKLTGLYKIKNKAFKVFDSSTDPQSTRKRTREPSE